MITTHITWTSSVLPKLTNAATSPFGRAINKSEASWITSIFALGSILGTYVFNYLSGKAGKKLTLLSAGIPCLVSNIIIYFTDSVMMYIVARFIVGLSIGTLFLFPIYVAELTHKNMRQVISIICSTGTCSGMLFSNCIGPFVSIQMFSLLLGTISAIFIIYFAVFGQEVPHYYIMKNQDILAREALEKLRGGYENIDEAFDEIRSKYEEEKAGKLKELFVSKPLIKGFVTCTLLLLFNQLSGKNIIIFYGQNIIRGVNPELSPEISMILLTVVIFITTLMASPVCCRFPKRTLLIFSGVGMFLSEAVLAIYIYSERNFDLPKSLNCLPLVCLTMFIAANSIGFGPLPFIILGEMFPNRTKAVAASSVGLIIGIVGFILTKYFMYVVDVIGMDGFFMCCAICCLFSTFFIRFYVIETKDKSLEEIQYELSL